MDPSLAAALAPRVKRLGYLGEFFQCLGHQPKALLAFQSFTDEAKAALPDRLTETIALTAATVLGNSYESHQHERLAVRLGFGRDWVAQVLSLGETTSLLSEEERAVQRFVVRALMSNGKGAGEPFEEVIGLLGSEAAVG